MNVIRTIIKLRLSPKGGVYRTLPLLTESCIAFGYSKLIGSITGLTYGACGALGDAKGLQSCYDIDEVAAKMSEKMRRDKHWIDRVRKRALRTCREFQKKLKENIPLARIRPERFLRFVISEYPWYMAGIGTYNLFWRYLEFATPDMVRFPQKGLQRLSIERNKLAEIYPPCEKALKQSANVAGKKFSIRGELLLSMTRSELTRTISSSRLAVPRRILSERAREYVLLSVHNKEYVTNNRREIRSMKRYFASQQIPHTTAVFHGKAVSPGRVTGTVVKKTKQLSWPKRPVFVTTMTHPNDIPLLRRIVGLVTDEGGGILSHAAIVARELKIPCIIGTRVASKMLKDGDRVAIDTKKGIVRKI